MSIREAIRDRMLSSVPELTDVVETHIADESIALPFGVVQGGGERNSTDWRGFIQSYTIWIFVKRETYNALDELTDKVVEALKVPMVTSAGKSFVCEYDGRGPDGELIEEWDALCYNLDFSIYAATREDREPLEDDWLTALAQWTMAELGPEWSSYSGYLPDNYTRPAVLWDITNVNTTLKTSGIVELRKTFRGYVLADSKTQRLEAVVGVVRGLRMAIKIPLYPKPLNYWLTVAEDNGNIERDGIDAVNINVSLYRNESTPRQQYPLMQKVEGRVIID